MKRAIVTEFGGLDVLRVVEEPDPAPGAGEARVRVSSIGMNHADLMARRGEYKLLSGEPPFTPGLEAGGVVDAVGEGVDAGLMNRRVILSANAPRANEDEFRGTYRSHYIASVNDLIPAPSSMNDVELGTLWLSYLTAWGCLVWKQDIQPRQVVALPAASSGVALAAAQIAHARGAKVIGLTTHAEKTKALREIPEADFDHLIVTRDDSGADNEWHRELRDLTDGRGVDVFFDPVAAGDYLNKEIRSLAQGGTIWVYGLLGNPDTVDVTPLIRKAGAIRGWLLNDLLANASAARSGYHEILHGFETGVYRQLIARTFPLDEVRAAHETMERGDHIGKLVLIP
ncbi:MAG: zinc-binding dehydrogenase [bacterium]|nr:zinc-binding dehydrogenase [bacterium]